MQHKKLFYLTNARMPTQRAHGLQIAKTCAGFATVFPDVTLVIPRGFNSITGDLFEYYNVKHNFRVRKLLSVDFSRWLEALPRSLYFVKSVSFAISVFLFMLLHTRKDDVIYFRYDSFIVFALIPFLHRRNVTCEAHFLLTGWQQKLLLKLENIVVVTEQAKKSYDRESFFDKKTFVAPDGVSVADFQLDISQADARTQLHLAQDKQLILYTGYFYKWKGIDPLILAAKQFNDNEELILVGGAGGDIERIKKIIAKEGITNVRLEGHRPYREMALYNKAADCVVVTASGNNKQSKYFTSPLKLFEYMASERPIVASDTPSIREVLSEENAVLVAPDDAERMLEGIRKVLRDRELAGSLVAKAKSDVVQYDWSVRAKKILDFIDGRASAPKVLYLFAGERRQFIEAYQNGRVSDSQLIGLNHLHIYGVRPHFFENGLTNFLRRLNFHLAPWPSVFVLHKYDVVFVGANLLFVLVVKKVLRMRSCKVVLYNTFLTNTIRRNKGSIAGKIIRSAIFSADLIICPSNAQRDFLIDYGVPKQKLQFIANGVDAEFFQPCSEQVADYIIAAGKDMGRDYLTLLKVAEHIPDKVIIICGKRNIDPTIQIPKNIQVIFDLNQKQLREYICKAKFVVLPTYNENTHFDASDCSGQYVLLESMAMGKAIIASERSTLSDYLVHNENGMIVPAEDVNALRKAMEYLSQHDQSVIHFGLSARERIVGRCNSNELAKSLSSIFLRTARKRID